MRKGRTVWFSHAFRRVVLVVATGLLLLPAAASAAPPPIGGITELPGTLACVSANGSSEAGANTCQVGRGIARPESVTVSPDGKFVYVGSYADSTEPSLTAFARNPSTGALTQLPGTGGCYTADGSSQAGPGTCTEVVGFGNGDGRDLAITSDGRFAYMVNDHEGSTPSPSIVLFTRDPATGVLTQPPGTAGCISSDGSSQAGAGTCQTLSLLSQPYSVTLSSDDRFLYVNDFGSPSRILVFARDPSTGALTTIQCLAEGSSAPTGCVTARDVGGTQTLVLSPDGTHAFDGDDSDRAISSFDRDPTTGLLTQLSGAAGCLSDTGNDNTGASTCSVGRELGYGIAISPDGHTLYVAGGSYAPSTSGGLAILHVYDDGTLSQLPGAAGCISDTGEDTTGSATCTAGRGLHFTYGVTISPDGRTVYVADDSTTEGVAVFSVDPSTGEATQLPGLAGCIDADGESNGTPGLCTQAPAVADDWIPTVSPDGSSVYLASYGDEAVTSFARETGPTCTGTNASTAYQTPLTVTLSCADTDGDALTTSVLAGPSHGSLGAVGPAVTYTPASGYTGTDSFTFDATDGTNGSAPATVTITVGAAPAQAPPGQTATTPPKITHAAQTHRTWREGKHGGTTFSFTLNEAARVTFTFTQKNRQRPLGSLTVAGHPGNNKLAFSGRISGHAKLGPGTYTVTIRAGASTPQRLTFTIVK